MHALAMRLAATRWQVEWHSKYILLCRCTQQQMERQYHFAVHVDSLRTLELCPLSRWQNCLALTQVMIGNRCMHACTVMSGKQQHGPVPSPRQSQQNYQQINH